MTDFPDTYLSASLNAGKVEVKQIPFPKEKLTAQTVVVQPLYMGVCRADVKELTASRDIPEDRGPLFGHEFIGTVVFAGTDTGFQEAQIVTFNPNITPKRTTGFAEHFFIEGDRETIQKSLTPINQTTSIEPPWQPEPFACIVHCVDVLLHHLKKENLIDTKIAVIGAGNSGLMFGMYMKELGGEITFFNRGEMRRKFAVEKGLFSEGDMKSFEEIDRNKNIFDIVVLVPTKIEPDTLALATTLTKNNGTVLLYGGTRKGDTLSTPNSNLDIDHIRRSEGFELAQLQDKTIFVSGGYGCSRSDFEKAIVLYTTNHSAFPLDKLISKEITLDQLPTVIASMASGKADYPGKVLVKG